MKKVLALGAVGLSTLALLWAISSRDRGPALAEGDAAELHPSPAQVEAGKVALARKLEKLERRGPKPFTKPNEAMKFFLEQRLPEGEKSLPLAHLRKELEKVRERSSNRLALGAEDEPQAGGIRDWKWVGPGNIGGRTRALVIDPNDPDVMYAAGVAGGIWKTTNAGASWNVADDLMLNLAVVSLAMDPANSNILYAGTGEGVFSGDVSVQGLGIFKSVDSGASWNQLSGTVSGVPSGAFHYVNKVVVSSNDSNRVYAGTRTGVWRSDNGGLSWNLVLGNPLYLLGPSNTNGSGLGCTELKIRTDLNPDVLYASFGNFQTDGLFRSFDGGDTWQAYTVPSNQGRTTVAFAPSDQDIMYLLMADNGTGGPAGQIINVYRSADGGNSFSAQVDFGSLTGPWLLSNLILATGCLEADTYSQGWYDNIIAVDPADPDIVWVGGVDIFRSDDGGVNFEIPGYWIFYTFIPLPPYQIHPDHHEIVFHPNYDGVGNQTMYVTNDGGIYRTTNARANTSIEDCPLPGDDPLPEVVWESLNNGYGVTQFYHGDSAKDRDVFVGGAQDNGTNRVQSADAPNDWQLILGGDGGYVAIDPRDSDVMFVEYQGFPNFWKSTDGGDSFEQAIDGITDDDGVFITPFAMDQSNPDVLWSGGSRPWRTTNSAASWEIAGPDFAGPDTITAIAIAPSDSNVVYLGFTNGYVVRTTNALDPLIPSWTIFTNGLFGSWISSIGVDPVNPNVAYLTYSNYGVPHILKTVDGGLNWSPIDGISFSGVPDIPVHWVTVRPCDSRQVYVATELGIFASENGGVTWEPANIGMANVVVESLDWKDDNTLVAFTHGRGTFVAELEPCPSEVQPQPQNKGRVTTVPGTPPRVHQR